MKKRAPNQRYQNDDIYHTIRTFIIEGKFTPYFRTLLCKRRITMKLTQKKLAKILRLTPQTINNWENGHTAKCNHKNRGALLSFMTGLIDKQLCLKNATTRKLKNRTLHEEYDTTALSPKPTKRKTHT